MTLGIICCYLSMFRNRQMPLLPWVNLAYTIIGLSGSVTLRWLLLCLIQVQRTVTKTPPFSVNSLKVYTGLIFLFSKVFSCSKKLFCYVCKLKFLEKDYLIPPEAINILRWVSIFVDSADGQNSNFSEPKDLWSQRSSWSLQWLLRMCQHFSLE